MYKTTFAHRRAAKNGDNDRLSTKLHFFLPPTNYFSPNPHSTAFPN